MFNRHVCEVYRLRGCIGCPDRTYCSKCEELEDHLDDLGFDWGSDGADGADEKVSVSDEAFDDYLDGGPINY